MSSIIQSRRDTAANWLSVNPILAQGEKGYETDSIGTSEALYKIGDGVSAWSTLPYQSSTYIKSTTIGEPIGSDVIGNIVSLTQAEYDAGTPVATTIYNITDA